MAETGFQWVPDDDPERLQALQRYGILDTPMEPAYDDLARIAAHICQAPVALISLLDRHRQWFKASVGLAVDETPLDQSVCRYAVRRPGVFIVPDLAQDARFAHYHIVTQENPLRFYAGAPLTRCRYWPIRTRSPVWPTAARSPNACGRSWRCCSAAVNLPAC